MTIINQNNPKKMKKTIISLLTLVLFTFSLTASAQTANNEYFIGKWDITVKATPEGDVMLHTVIESNEGTLSGSYIKEVSGVKSEPVKMKSVAVKGEEMTLAFEIAGYNVTMNLVKKDNEHANGNMMDMFDCAGIKVKN
jgi:hypothetical protein